MVLILCSAVDEKIYSTVLKLVMLFILVKERFTHTALIKIFYNYTNVHEKLKIMKAPHGI